MLSVWLLPPHGPGGGLLRHFESAWAPTKTVGFLSSFEIEKMGKRLRSRSGLSSRGLLFLVSRLGHASEAIVAFPCLHHTPWRRGEVQMAPLEPSFFFMGFVPPFVRGETEMLHGVALAWPSSIFPRPPTPLHPSAHPLRTPGPNVGSLWPRSLSICLPEVYRRRRPFTDWGEVGGLRATAGQGRRWAACFVEPPLGQDRRASSSVGRP